MTYPTRAEIEKMFSHIGSGDWESFMQNVSPQVDWTIMGTSPMSQTFPDLKAFQAATLQRLRKILTDTLHLKVRNIVGGAEDGSQDWCAVEMTAVDAKCVNGTPYPMMYNWVCRFDESAKIVQVRAYLDTELLTRVLRENECPVYNTPLNSYAK